MARIDHKQIDALIEGPKRRRRAGLRAAATGRAAAHQRRRRRRRLRRKPSPSTISPRIDLRIARIVNAEHVEGADKLLSSRSTSAKADQRTVFAGIKSAYDPAR